MSISDTDLLAAFHTIQCRWQRLSDCVEWEDVRVIRQTGADCLRIRKRLHVSTPRLPQHTAGGTQYHEEDDNEALQYDGRANLDQPSAIYDIIFSPLYQVPILYVTFQGLPSGPRLEGNEVYELLVPDVYRSQVKSVGIMGALSMTEHPLTGSPAYFIHPCQTQEFMSALLKSRESAAEEYFMLWIGVVGASVGLCVPTGLAGSLSQTPASKTKA